MVDGRTKTGKVVNALKKGVPKIQVNQGEVRTPIASDMYIPNHSGDHSKGRVYSTPVGDYDIANKKYVDDNAGGGAPEGTAVKSTGEGGGTKFLREDGDGTCSWQTAPAGYDFYIEEGDVAKANSSASDLYLDFDGGDFNTSVVGNEVNVTIEDSGINHNSLMNTHNLTTDINHDNLTGFVAAEHYDWTADQGANNINNANITALPMANTGFIAGTNCTLSTNTLNVDDAFIKNDADDTSTHKITAANFAVTGDNNTNDSEYVPMVLHGTDATPPTASGLVQGTIYIQYTA